MAGGEQSCLSIVQHAVVEPLVATLHEYDHISLGETQLTVLQCRVASLCPVKVCSRWIGRGFVVGRWGGTLLTRGRDRCDWCGADDGTVALLTEIRLCIFTWHWFRLVRD